MKGTPLGYLDYSLVMKKISFISLISGVIVIKNTFFSSSLMLRSKKTLFVPLKPYQPSLMFAGKARSRPS